MDKLTFISNLIDSITWPLLAVIGLFVLRKPISKLIPQIQKLKFRDLEAEFQTLSVSDQSLLFLDGVARKDQWTFYGKARSGERELGQAFYILVKDLIKVEKNELLDKLNVWLNSGEPNLQWFACEIIGYFKIVELKGDLSGSIPSDIHQDWKPHQLNCLWARSRLSDMKELYNTFLKTKSEYNQKWLLFVYEQMLSEKHISLETCIETINSYLNREDITDEMRSVAKVTLGRL